MSGYRLLVRDDAEEEIAAAAEWYESRTPGLGSRFLDAIQTTLDQIHQNPHLYQILKKGIRRVQADPFAYGIFYRIRSDRVVELLSVLHLSRDPRIWERYTLL